VRKRVRTAPKNPQKERQDMGFGHFLDRHGTYFDTTHFPQAYASYPFRGRGFYRLTGKVVDDFGHPSVEITEMQPLRTRRQNRPGESAR